MPVTDAVALGMLIITLGGLIWRSATLAQQVEELRKWREKHEPTAVELVQVQATLQAVMASLVEIKADIQRLYDRSRPSAGGR